MVMLGVIFAVFYSIFVYSGNFEHKELVGPDTIVGESQKVFELGQFLLGGKDAARIGVPISPLAFIAQFPPFSVPPLVVLATLFLLYTYFHPSRKGKSHALGFVTGGVGSFLFMYLWVQILETIRRT